MKRYYGAEAIKKVEELEGRPLSLAERRVVEEEGYVEGVYKDDKGVSTSGVGQTGKYQGMSFSETFEAHAEYARNVIEDFDGYPEEVQAELVQLAYRGDLQESKTFRKLFNEGKYEEASAELLNHGEYRRRKAKGEPDGVVRRLEAASRVFAGYKPQQESAAEGVAEEEPTPAFVAKDPSPLPPAEEVNLPEGSSAEAASPVTLESPRVDTMEGFDQLPPEVQVQVAEAVSQTVAGHKQGANAERPVPSFVAKDPQELPPTEDPLAGVPSMSVSNPAPLPPAIGQQTPQGSPSPVAAATTPSAPFMDTMEGFDLGGSVGFDLEAPLLPTAVTVPRTDLATNEAATLVSGYTGQPAEAIHQSLEMGNEEAISGAVADLRQKLTDDAYVQAEQKIADASTPEEVEEAVEAFKFEEGKPVSLVDFRKNWVIKQIDSPEWMPRVDALVQQNYELARSAQIVEERMWENASFTDVLADFGELVFPISGVVEEEWIKYNNSVSDALDNIDAAGTPEQKQAVLESLLADWENTETQLFSRNNTLINMSQVAAIKDAILQGGLQLADGEITAAEAQQNFESAVNAAFGVSELKGIAMGFKGIAKWLHSKMTPKKSTELARGPLEGDLILGGQDNLLNPPTTRTGASAKHIEYIAKPENAIADAVRKGLANVADEHGLSPQQLGAELTPTPTSNVEMGMPNVVPDRQTLNEFILADASLSNVGMTRARKLEQEVGSSLKVVDSSAGFIPDDTEQTWGTFQMLLGDNNARGFETAEQAERAAKNFVLGHDYEVVRGNNGYFVKANVEAEFDVARDVAGLNTNTVKGALQYVLDPLRVLGEEVLNGVFALKSKNRAAASDLEKRTQKLFKGIGRKDAKSLLKALDKGDADEVEWFTETDFLRDNPYANKKVYERYRGLREVMDDIFETRNKTFRARKESLGYKWVNVGEDGNLGRRIFGKDIDVDNIYDVESGTYIKKADLDDTSIVMRLDNAIPTDEGMANIVRVKPEKVSKLPAHTLRKRDGHIDRMYRDAGWIVKTTEDVVLNGVKRSKPIITHIVKTKDEAKRIADETGGEFQRSRENDELDTIFADEDSVQYGYGSTHTKKRGEAMTGADGRPAPTLNAFESIQRAIAKVEKDLDTNIVASLESRFFNEFGSILRKGKATAWDKDLSSMLAAGTSKDSDVYRAAKQWHSYVNVLKGARTARVFRAIDDMFSSLEGKGFGKWRVPSSDAQAVSNSIQKFTAQVVIVGRPLFQIPQNLMQMTYLAMKDPLEAPVAIAQMPFIMALNMAEKPNLWMASKVLGVSESEAAKLLSELKSSGMLEGVGRADDFLAMTSEAATAPSTSALKTAKRAATAPVRGVFKASQKAQEMSTKMVNVAAYLTEYRRQVVRKGRPFNAKTKKDVSFGAQKMTQTQNGINQFAYQDKNNPISMGLQFMQHIHKLFLDIVADPVVKATTGRNIGKSPSAFAESRGKAFFTVMSTISVFGLSGILGEGGGTWTEDKIRETFPEIDGSMAEFIVNGGLLNTLMNSAAEYRFGEGRADISGKMGPAALLDTVNSYYLDNPGQLDTLGASGSVMDDVWKRVGWGGSAWAIAAHPQMDTAEKVSNVWSEVASIVKGYGDYEKAVIAMNMGRWPYMNTLSSDMRVTEMEALWGLMNIQPDTVADYYNRADFSGAKRDATLAEKNASVMMRAMSRAMAEEARNGKLDILKSIELVEKYSNYAKAITDPSKWETIESEFRIKAMSSEAPTYERYIKPYIESADVGERIKSLELALQKATTEEHKQQIQGEIDMFKLFDTESKEIYGVK